MMISESPEATASSTTYWIIGLSTSGSISLGCAFVAGRKRVPSPAAGKTALRTFMDSLYVPLPGRPTTSQEHERRDVRERARHGAHGGGADQERQRDAPEQLEQIGRQERRRGMQELDDLPDVGPVQVRHDQGADAQREAVHEGREPRQVEPGAGDRDGAVQAEERGDHERQERLQAPERRAADEDADRQRQRHAPGRIVEAQHRAEPREHGPPDANHGRGLHRPTPSSTATIARMQAAWIRISTASRGVASFSRIAERPRVEARKKIKSTLCLRVRPSDSNRWWMWSRPV